jgi:cyclopropane fatty-acyl-phospholipid synthase-like methyltransferase
MKMDLLDLIIEYHKDNERQGPGSEEATLRALSFFPDLNENTKILDVGCGTGGQTITLAKKYGCTNHGNRYVAAVLRKACKKC